MADLVAGVAAVLDAEQVTSAHVVGSSFGGYLAQCLVRDHPQRVDSLVLAQSGVRHFVGPVPIAVLHALLAVAPPVLVRAFIWRTWRALLTDIGPEQAFWMSLLRDILDHQLSKAHLVAMLAAVGDFTGHHRPVPGDLAGWHRPVLVLQSEHDRAFAGQAEEIRAVYPTAAFHVFPDAGHGALFTHTAQYVDQLRSFLAARGAHVTQAAPPDECLRPPAPDPQPGAAHPARGVWLDLVVTIRRTPAAVFGFLADVQDHVAPGSGVRMTKLPDGPPFSAPCGMSGCGPAGSCSGRAHGSSGGSNPRFRNASNTWRR